MGSGGARANRNAPVMGSATMARNAAEWTKLPKREGIGIDVPDWPIGFSEPSEQEWEAWEYHWLHMAQAAIWEAEGLHYSVAQYIRTLIDSQKGRRSSQHGTLAKQMREELLLSPAALRSQKYVIVGSEDADILDSITGEKAAETPETPQERNPLRVVKGA